MNLDEILFYLPAYVIIIAFFGTLSAIAAVSIYGGTNNIFLASAVGVGSFILFFVFVFFQNRGVRSTMKPLEQTLTEAQLTKKGAVIMPFQDGRSYAILPIEGIDHIYKRIGNETTYTYHMACPLSPLETEPHYRGGDD